jgi:hypothetical protein
MSARISRALNDDNPTDGLTEHALECHGNWLRQYKAASEERAPRRARYRIATQ